MSAQAVIKTLTMPLILPLNSCNETVVLTFSCLAASFCFCCAFFFFLATMFFFTFFIACWDITNDFDTMECQFFVDPLLGFLLPLIHAYMWEIKESAHIMCEMISRTLMLTFFSSLHIVFAENLNCHEGSISVFELLLVN